MTRIEINKNSTILQDSSAIAQQSSYTVRELLPPEQMIRLTTRLKRETTVESRDEKRFKSILLNHNVFALYEPLMLFARNISSENKTFMYLPDFLLPFNRISGKAIVIEPHFVGLPDLDYFRKLKAIRDEYGLYIAVYSNLRAFYKLNTEDSRIIRDHNHEFVDELWAPASNGVKICKEKLMDLLRRSEVSSSSALPELIKKAERNRIECQLTRQK